MKKLLLCLLCLGLCTGCGVYVEKVDVPRETLEEAPGLLPEEAPDGELWIPTEAPGETPTEPSPEEALGARAEELLAAMTPAQKVGQVFLVRCPGPNGDGAGLMERYQPGGYLLFKRDFQNAAGEWLTSGQVRERLEGYAAAAALAPMFGVDEEGGTVCRASLDPLIFPEGRLPSPRELFEQGGMPAIAQNTAYKNDVLLQMGINVNLAPVVDITTRQGDFMYQRSLGQDGQTTAAFVETVAAIGQAQGMGSVLKHFPGYGPNGDTHTGSVTDTRSREQFDGSDLVPFRAAASLPGAAILVSHNVVACMDDSLPASLSPKVYDLLRRELGFDGVALTDDLMMDAVKDYAGDGSAALMALQAGADMVITSHPDTDIPRVLEAASGGQLSAGRLEEAVLRVLKWKLTLGILE